MATPNKSLIVPPNYELAIYGWQFTHVEIEGTEVKAMRYDTCIDSRNCNFSNMPETFKQAINYIYGIER